MNEKAWSLLRYYGSLWAGLFKAWLNPGFLMRCSVYIVCPAVLSCSNLKLHQTLEIRDIFKQEKIILPLTFNPGFCVNRLSNNPGLACVSQKTRKLLGPVDFSGLFSGEFLGSRKAFLNAPENTPDPEFFGLFSRVCSASLIVIC